MDFEDLLREDIIAAASTVTLAGINWYLPESKEFLPDLVRLARDADFLLARTEFLYAIIVYLFVGFLIYAGAYMVYFMRHY